MDAVCRIELLGGLRVEQAGRSITRFRTYKTGVLLAYLAFYLDKPHPREALTELLWPECDSEAGRNSLSKSLGSLRNQLEPPGVPAGAVILADRASVRLNARNCSTDVAAFNAALRKARSAQDPPHEQIVRLVAAVELYRGELLPGLYEDWNIAERGHLAENYCNALQRLIALLERGGDLRRAREYARRAIAADPLREEVRQSLILLSLADHDPASALRQYHEWERLAAKELGSVPSAELRALIAPWLDAAPTPVPSPTVPPEAPDADSRSSLSPQEALLGGTMTLLLIGPEGAERAAQMAPVVCRHGGVFPPESATSELTPFFARATEAAACAVALQRAAAGTQAGVRMALQTGEVDAALGLARLQQDGARTLGATPPGQILCSEATAVLLRRDPEPGLQIVERGLYRLPGDPKNERLFEVRYSGGPADNTALPNAEPASRATLPLQMTRFFGREQELAHLLRAVTPSREGPGDRLWTLTGPGGMGKTRLSLEIARRSMEASAGAVWFVPLAEINDPRLILNAVMEALQIVPSPGTDPLTQIGQALAERPTLLVLDNLEQLVGPAAPSLEAVQSIARLLEQTPTLACLVTSRHRLGLTGEREFPLSPLPVPAGPATPEALAAVESVRLFLDRAQAVRPDFQLTPGNAEAVADLCERLEGLPLAIELAAARAQVLTPAQMLKQLERRFDFLVSRRRDFAQRHRTIRAAIDWSYGLLTPDLRRFAALLSVFRGGWTLSAAEAVTGEALALDFLEQLVDCSLVLADAGALGEMRYRQLETLRQYAEEGLSSDEQMALRVRHIACFVALAEEAAPHLLGPEQGEWLGRLELDHDNFRAALQWCSETPAFVESGLRLASALWRFWHVRGHITEGRERLGRLLTAAEAQSVDPGVFADAQIAAGILARYQNDNVAAGELLRPGLEAARRRADLGMVALALYHLGMVDVSLGRWAAARSRLDENLSICRANDDPAGLAAALGSLAIVESQGGDFTVAQGLFTEALALRRSLGDQQGIATLLLNLGNVALLQMDYERARTLFEESLALRRELADRWGIASLLNSLGLLLSNQGDYAAARPLLEESVAIFRDLGDKNSTAVALENLGTVALMTQDPRAQELLSESLILRWNSGDIQGVAYSLEALARLHTVTGDTTRAATLWAVTQTLREAIQAPLPPSHRAAVEQSVAAAREALSAHAFQAAWAHGQGLELEQALALVLDEAPSLTLTK